MNYDVKQYNVLVNGVQISGFAEDSAINIEPSDDDFVTYVGSDGGVSRSKNNGVYDILTLTLAQTSQSNDYLSGLSAVDRNTGLGVLNIIIQDLIGNTIFASATAYIVRRPNMEASREISEREWLIHMPPTGESFVGGNFNLGESS